MNDIEKTHDCLSEESIARVVRLYPNITTAEVLAREARKRQQAKPTTELKDQFTKLLGQMLGVGDQIQAAGSKVFEKRNSVKLIPVQTKLPFA